MKYFCFTSSKPFDFGAEPDHDPQSGIFSGMFSTAGRQL